MKILNFGSINIDKVYQMKDFVSAGDTFAGYFLAAMCKCATVDRALELASAAAAIAVTRHGASPSIPVRAEVEKFLSE